LQVHSVKPAHDSVATNAAGDGGGGDGGGDGDPQEIRKMLEKMMKIGANASLPPQKFHDHAKVVKNSKAFQFFTDEQRRFFWKLEKNKIDANMFTHPIP